MISSITKDEFSLDQVVQEISSETLLNEFKSLFSQVCKACRDNQPVNDALKLRTQYAFRNILSYVNDLIFHSDRFDQEQKDLIGNWIHQEFIAFCLLGTWPSRSLRKPQDIAGDHHTIKQIYDDGDQERRQVGHVVNYCFLNEPACKAVKNRKDYIVHRILDLIAKSSNQVNVASIASGPAEELLLVYDMLDRDGKKELKATAIDLDFRACAFVNDEIQSNKLQNYFSVVNGNVLKAGTLPNSVKGNQDLVYSMGLIDYFSEGLAIKTVNNMFDMLKPGGEVIIGNFHDSCNSRIFLDYLLDWELIYRTEDDMRAIFSKSRFQNQEVVIDYEEENVNMLVRCKKPE